MESYVFRMPSTVNYGRHAFERIGKEAAERGNKALVVSDHVMDSLGYVRKAKEYLNHEGVESALYLGVESEPTDTYVAEAMKIFKNESCDIVISLGGGSCIDTAKAVSVLAVNGGYIGEYMGGRKIASKNVPHIAIPTTAGTGSEATDVTIITNTTNDVKMMIKQPAFMPDAAIVDPLLTVTSPKNVTAATGIDALSHAIEAYISRRAHPMTDDMARSAMKLIVGHIKTAYEDGENIDAREAMSLGAMQAGVAFSNSSVCLVHGMSRPIGALFHVPHGYSNAMLLPAVLEFSKTYAIERLADLGRIFDSRSETWPDDQAADLAVNAVKDLCLELNIPNLKEWGIEEESFDSAIRKMATDALESGSPSNNPRVPDQLEIEELYRVCYNYEYLESKLG
ncbi:iron-containing alcohol dehydrogenase [Halobacillus karajensis]|uniref:Alcohol dehydrogenase 2 n=1 Tax=Halobacillus karajensis TaxID=195088 RepID=A0A024P7Y0_9BACI|nr:iron-containing alcohol dehydrogenase [Halobacillus karajensis]CDQ20123.1 Alcohol dehydrogenase 2 [Halobacillus karajensis]CDQ25214.1 Alcohol dehydrogenase 2 [Halobacillus karajensis]CDQ28425.1 Alcohol dehydrogenase 2 [Halobacillus karajensis]